MNGIDLSNLTRPIFIETLVIVKGNVKITGLFPIFLVKLGELLKTSDKPSERKDEIHLASDK
jgi:hypothetical protein